MTPEEIRNEHRKHIASWCNTLAAGIIAAGTFIPAANFIFKILPATTHDGLVIGIGSICAGIGFALHLWGHRTLGSLE